MDCSKLSQLVGSGRGGEQDGQPESNRANDGSSRGQLLEAVELDGGSELRQRRPRHHTHPDNCPDDVTSRPCLSLAMVSPGDKVAVYDIRGGRKLRQRLLDLGLNQGATVRVLKNDFRGPLIVAVKEDGRLALGRGMTQRILVTEVDS